MLHEINDQLDTIKPVTKWAHRILDPAEIPAAVHEAFHQLKTGRPRPVEIEIPPETLEDQADVDLFEPEEYAPQAPSDDRIQQAAHMIAGAKNPLLYVGGGAISSNASAALESLAEFLQSPVLMTAEGKGALSDRHYLSIGGMNFRNDPYMQRMKDHDIAVLVGTRNAYPGFLSQKVIQIDIDPEEIGRNYDDTYGLVGDARLTLEKLQDALSAHF